MLLYKGSREKLSKNNWWMTSILTYILQTDLNENQAYRVGYFLGSHTNRSTCVWSRRILCQSPQAQILPCRDSLCNADIPRGFIHVYLLRIKAVSSCDNPFFGNNCSSTDMLIWNLYADLPRPWVWYSLFTSNYPTEDEPRLIWRHSTNII